MALAGMGIVVRDEPQSVSGRMLLASGTRLATGMTLSNWVFSLGGRLKGGAIARGALVFALSVIGAVYRVCLRMNQAQTSVMETDVYPILSAIITGEDRVFHLARDIGVDSYFELRSYLRTHPEAIQLQDGELQIMQSAINWVFDFVEDPAGFSSMFSE